MDCVLFSTGLGVMVESPTYYHSLSPVLRSLKEFDMESFPLQEEVVYARPTELPGYLKEATFQTSIVCPKKKSTAVEVQENKPKDPEKKDSSEPSKTNKEDWSNKSEAIEGEDWDRKSSNEKLNIFKTNFTLSRRSSSSDSLNEFRDSLSDFCLEEKMDTNSLREDLGGHKECKGLDDHVFMHIHCEIDQSEIDRVNLGDEHKKEQNLDFTSLDFKEEEPSVDIEEAIKKYSLSSDIPEASKLSEPRDMPSHGKLGGRMNVEDFLETFSSKSESSLEASQCDALVHALKNKLAIVQG